MNREMIAELTDDDWDIIEDALIHLHSHYVNRSVRKRSVQKNVKDKSKHHERVKAIREGWIALVNKAHSTLIKVDQIVN